KGFFHRAQIAAYRDALRQMDDVHTVAAGRGTALADVGRPGKTRLPYRTLLGIAYDKTGELALARISAVGVEGKGLSGACAEMAGDGRVGLARVADIDRRFRHAAADADRHKHRLDPVVAKAVGSAGLVQHHVPGSQLHLDDLVAPGPADGQHTL